MKIKLLIGFVILLVSLLEKIVGSIDHIESLAVSENLYEIPLENQQ